MTGFSTNMTTRKDCAAQGKAFEVFRFVIDMARNCQMVSTIGNHPRSGHLAAILGDVPRLPARQILFRVAAWQHSVLVMKVHWTLSGAWLSVSQRAGMVAVISGAGDKALS